MKQEEEKIAILSKYLISIFEKYTLKYLGVKEKKTINVSYRRGIIDRHFKLKPKEKIERPTPELIEICESLIEKIFLSEKYINISLPVLFQGKWVQPKKENAFNYIVGLWYESMLYLDDIYLSLRSEDNILIQKNVIQIEKIPSERALFFSWLIFKIANLINILTPSLRTYMYILISKEKDAFNNDNESILDIMIQALSYVFFTPFEKILFNILSDYLVVYSSDQKLNGWIKKDQFIKGQLIKTIQENPVILFERSSYSHFESKINDIINFQSKLKLDKNTIYQGLNKWIEKNLPSFLEHNDIKENPKLLFKWQDLFEPSLMKRIQNLFKEYKVPLHKRNIPLLPDQLIKSYGEFRIVEKKTREEYADRDYLINIYQILEKYIDESWKEVLEVEIYSYEREPFEPKEYKNEYPKLIPQIFVDEAKDILYIEKEDGTLFYSKNKGLSWEDGKHIKPTLYEQEIDRLKYFNVKINSRES